MELLNSNITILFYINNRKYVILCPTLFCVNNSISDLYSCSYAKAVTKNILTHLCVIKSQKKSIEHPFNHLFFLFIRSPGGSIVPADCPGSSVAPSWPVTAWALSSFCLMCSVATGKSLKCILRQINNWKNVKWKKGHLADFNLGWNFFHCMLNPCDQGALLYICNWCICNWQGFKSSI